jgi:ABC-type glycerol-3-phosphate transport system substrate-binding protein
MYRRVTALSLLFAIVAFPILAGGQGEQGRGANEAGLSVVRYLNQETDPQVVNVQRGWVEGYRQEYPQYDVILDNAPNTVINQTIATYLQAGAPLDVLHADGGSAGRMAVAGQLAPLDEVVEALGGRDEFLPGRLLIYDDVVYAINQAPATPVLHYRTDVFKEAGLNPPTTYEELMEAARKLHSDEMAGIALPGGENRGTTIYSGIFLWGYQGNYFDEDLNVTIDNERTREAMQYYADLLQYAPPDAAGWAFTEQVESFMAGRAAMLFYWHGLDLIRRGNPDILDRVSVVQFPKGEIQVTEQGGRYVSIFADSENLDASKAWVEYIFRPENAMDLTHVQPMLYPPATYGELALAQNSNEAAFADYGELLLNEVYPSAEFAYNQIFHAGGISPEYDSPQDTWIINPLVSVVWNSNLYARAVQRVAYEGVSVDRAVRDLQRDLEQQVEVAREDLGL